MLGLLFIIFSSCEGIFIPRYGDSCQYFIVGECHLVDDEAVVLTAMSPEECQQGCSKTPNCNTFRHFAPSHCTLHPSDYRDNCGIVGGPTGEPGLWGGGQYFLDCMEAIAEEPDSCNRMREEECAIEGGPAYRQPGVDKPELCADICSVEHGGSTFRFWMWKGGVEQRCDCYKTASLTCMALAGPPEPSIEYCMNPHPTTQSTYSSHPTTHSTPPTPTDPTNGPTTSTDSNTEPPLSEVIIITGGNDGSSWNGGSHSEVETLGSCNSLIQDLPYPRRAHITTLTADGLVLTCGGDSDFSCLSLVAGLEGLVWMDHSTLDTIRWYTTAVTLPGGLYILGGYRTETTSSFLATGTTTWVPGPELPGGGSDSGCAVAISSSRFLLIGGEPAYQQVAEYDSTTGAWTQWPALSIPVGGRRRHSCARLGDNVIIAGGQDQYHEDPPEDLVSTAILHIPTKSMRSVRGMTTRRSSFGTAVIGGKLLAFGGYNRYLSNYYLDSVEEWNEEEEVWREREEKLELARDFFGYAAASCPRQP